MYCSHCGGSNPDGAGFCQYCGSPLQTSGPLPSVTPSPPLPSSQGTYTPMGTPPPPPRRRGLGRTVLIILVVFVVVILVTGVALYFLAPAPANVQVTGINFQSPDDACGLNGATDPSWYNTTVGQSFALSYEISGNNTTAGGTAACQITAVTTPTAGFGISGADVPLQILANTSQIFSFTVNPPGSSFTGVLTIVLT